MLPQSTTPALPPQHEPEARLVQLPPSEPISDETASRLLRLRLLERRIAGDNGEESIGAVALIAILCFGLLIALAVLG